MFGTMLLSCSGGGDAPLEARLVTVSGEVLPPRGAPRLNIGGPVAPNGSFVLTVPEGTEVWATREDGDVSVRSASVATAEGESLTLRLPECRLGGLWLTIDDVGTVLEVWPGAPWQAIVPGDRIVEVDGVPYLDSSRGYGCTGVVVEVAVSRAAGEFAGERLFVPGGDDPLGVRHSTCGAVDIQASCPSNEEYLGALEALNIRPCDSAARGVLLTRDACNAPGTGHWRTVKWAGWPTNASRNSGWTLETCRLMPGT